MLPAIAWLLRAITGQPLRRVALIGLLAVVPLRTNFQFGQQHLFVLFLLTVATWCYFRGHDVSAGAVLAVAAAVKLYPAGFVLLLVRKKRWRALAGMAVAGLLIAAAGIALFGVEPWSVFAREIVPRAVLRAEVTDPYDTHMSSLAGMLRRLLIFEPELNPHPLVHAPAAFAVLQPLFAAAILATGLWLLTSGRASPERERLDWGATLAFILLLSTGTPTYHLCALILAAVLAVDCQLRMQWVTGARALLIAFTVLCLVTQDLIPEAPAGWRIFSGYPRVYALAVCWLLMVAAQRRLGGSAALDRRRAARFAVVFGALVVASSWSWMRHFDGQFAHYARLLPPRAGGWPAAHPAADRQAVFFVRMDPSGYVLKSSAHAPPDHSAGGHGPVPSDRRSRPVRGLGRGGGRGRLAHRPFLAARGRAIRCRAADGDRGCRNAGRLRRWQPARVHPNRTRAGPPVVARAFHRRAATRHERRLGRVRFRVLPGQSGGVRRTAGRTPGLFVIGAGAAVSSPTPLVPSDRPMRNPAVSPDGRWLAYAERDRGNWQLWLRSLERGESRRLTSADCNSISPAWRPDSRSLVYATDCARGVALTTLAELHVVP